MASCYNSYLWGSKTRSHSSNTSQTSDRHRQPCIGKPAYKANQKCVGRHLRVTAKSLLKLVCAHMM